MKPRKPPLEQDDLPRARLIGMIDMRHEPVKLETRTNRKVFEREWIGFLPSHTARPATLTRLVAGLLHLQHAFALSDEAVMTGWAESPYWQHFRGETFFRHCLPVDPSSLTRWRKRIGEEGGEWLLTRTIAGLSRRRGATKPIIGHMKNDGRLTRCPLKGTGVDALLAVLRGCGRDICMIRRHLRTVLRLLIWMFTSLRKPAAAAIAQNGQAQIVRSAA